MRQAFGIERQLVKGLTTRFGADVFVHHLFAVLFQILIFGRALDDVSRDPIDEALWESSIGLLFADLLKH